MRGVADARVTLGHNTRIRIHMSPIRRDNANIASRKNNITVIRLRRQPRGVGPTTGGPASSSTPLGMRQGPLRNSGSRLQMIRGWSEPVFPERGSMPRERRPQGEGPSVEVGRVGIGAGSRVLTGADRAGRVGAGTAGAAGFSPNFAPQPGHVGASSHSPGSWLVQ